MTSRVQEAAARLRKLADVKERTTYGNWVAADIRTVLDALAANDGTTEIVHPPPSASASLGKDDTVSEAKPSHYTATTAPTETAAEPSVTEYDVRRAMHLIVSATIDEQSVRRVLEDYASRQGGVTEGALRPPREAEHGESPPSSLAASRHGAQNLQQMAANAYQMLGEIRASDSADREPVYEHLFDLLDAMQDPPASLKGAPK